MQMFEIPKSKREKIKSCNKYTKKMQRRRPNVVRRVQRAIVSKPVFAQRGAPQQHQHQQQHQHRGTTVLPLIGPVAGQFHSQKADRLKATAPPQPRLPRPKIIDNWVPKRAYSDSNTFYFGAALIVIIVVGIFIGRRNRAATFRYG